MNKNLKVISMPGSHEYIVELFESFPHGAVLDSPCGSGAITQRLARLGFDMFCCDLDPGNFQLHDEFPFENADFNQDSLPYKDKKFDYVICANGLHRLFYPANILAEFSRVLKDDGVMVLSWPNYNSLARRIKYFLSASLGSSIDFAEYDQTINSPAAKVRFPLSASRIQYLLAKENMAIESMDSIGLHKAEYLLMPFSFSISIFNKFIGKITNNDFAVIKGGTTTIAVCKKL